MRRLRLIRPWHLHALTQRLEGEQNNRSDATVRPGVIYAPFPGLGTDDPPQNKLINSWRPSNGDECSHYRAAAPFSDGIFVLKNLR